MAEREEIKHLVQTEGWQIVLAMFKEEFDDFRKNIKTEGRTAKDIAVELIAKQEAAQMVKRVLAKVNRIANQIEVSKQSYK